jgi:hypothetical protein
MGNNMDLIKLVELKKVRGVMKYYYSSIGTGNLVLELEDGRVVKIKTKDPEKNKLILAELEKLISLHEKITKG